MELSDGQLVQFNEKVDVTSKVQRVVTFAESCQTRGMQFVFVLAPSKIARSDVAYAGKTDFSNENGDAFVKGLRDAGVPCLDLRDAVEAEGLSQHELFYRTDHHWTASTGRWASQKLLSYLNDACGYSADVSLLAPEQFDEEAYPSWYLGSRGRKVTLARTTPDDFILYYPKFETSFHLVVPSRDVDLQGDFSIFYDMERMSLAEGYYKSSAYDAYAYGLVPFLSSHNDRKRDGKKLLLVRDSYADCMIPFLALGMENLQSIVLRRFTGSLQSFLDQEQPDTVVVEYFIEELPANEDNKPPHTAMFDFR